MESPDIRDMLAVCADRAEELGDAATAGCLRWLSRNAGMSPTGHRRGRLEMLRALIENVDRMAPDDTITIHWREVNFRPDVVLHVDEARPREGRPMTRMDVAALETGSTWARPAPSPRGAMNCPRCGAPLDCPTTRFKLISPPFASATCPACGATTTVFRDRDGGLHATAAAARAADRTARIADIRGKERGGKTDG